MKALVATGAIDHTGFRRTNVAAGSKLSRAQVWSRTEEWPGKTGGKEAATTRGSDGNKFELHQIGISHYVFPTHTHTPHL